MHETNTVFEQLNSIRIGEKTREEIRREETIRFEERKLLEDAAIKQKQLELKQTKEEAKLRKKTFWKDLFSQSHKVTFN